MTRSPVPALPALPASLLRAVPSALPRAARLPVLALALPFAALAALPLPAAAQEPQAQGMGQMHGMHGVHHMARLTVQGRGQASTSPDQATISLGVTTQAPTAAQAMTDNATRQQAVLDALKAEGIAAEDIQTQGLNLSPVQSYPNDGTPPSVTGYQAQNIVSARIRALDRLGPTLDAVVSAGATDVQNIAFTREDSSEAEDTARTRAVTEAQRRAGVMAAAAGMRLGPLLSLAEAQTGSGPMPMMMARDAKAGGATPIETGQLTLSADVTATWALLPLDGAEGNGAMPGMSHEHPATPAAPQGSGESNAEAPADTEEATPSN